jgi:16S rRNA C967 or C1407 C5-methylase (RsmB/RsmF family)
MKYAIKIGELIIRPVIRDDQVYEFLNKMTDEEIDQWDKEVSEMLKEENVPEMFPDWNVAYMAKLVDRQILYDLFLLADSKDKIISTKN